MGIAEGEEIEDNSTNKRKLGFVQSDGITAFDGYIERNWRGQGDDQL